MIEGVLNVYTHEMVRIDQIQFGYVSCRPTTDATLICQLQEKYTAANNNWFTFIDLGKPFNHVQRKIPWWFLRSLSVAQGIVHVIQGIYSKA